MTFCLQSIYEEETSTYARDILIRKKRLGLILPLSKGVLLCLQVPVTSYVMLLYPLPVVLLRTAPPYNYLN